MTDAFRKSDSAEAFRAALKENGYVLAQGDQRRFVIVDRYGNVHSLARQVEGAKTTEVARKLSRLTPDRATDDARPAEAWPPVEEAIRARASARQARLAKLAAAMDSDKEYTPIEIMRARADALVQRGTALKKLVDAWQPLYDTLDARQKVRLRILAVLAVREMRDRVAERLEAADHDDEEE